MALIMQIFSAMMADSQWKHEQQMTKMNAGQDREQLENIKLHKESRNLKASARQFGNSLGVAKDNSVSS